MFCFEDRIKIARYIHSHVNLPVMLVQIYDKDVESQNVSQALKHATNGLIYFEFMSCIA